MVIVGCPAESDPAAEGSYIPEQIRTPSVTENDPPVARLALKLPRRIWPLSAISEIGPVTEHAVQPRTAARHPAQMVCRATAFITCPAPCTQASSLSQRNERHERNRAGREASRPAGPAPARRPEQCSPGCRNWSGRWIRETHPAALRPSDARKPPAPGPRSVRPARGVPAAIGCDSDLRPPPRPRSCAASVRLAGAVAWRTP